VFKPVARHASLVDTVAEQIRGLVSRGELRSGDRLPREDELVAKFGVSRGVLREAMGRLKATGLVTIQRGRGMFVNAAGGVASAAGLIGDALSLAAKDLAQFAEFRSVLECYGARRAAALATPGELDALEALCRKMNSKDVDFLESVRLDFQFHLRIVDFTGNELLHRAMEVLHEFTLASMIKTTPNPRDHEFSFRFHMKIVDALRSGDPDVAERAMREHMNRTRGDLERVGRKERRRP
jgi:GntR family transcriptional regulator, transcriptional repressor for pyruvate dehydrogenase complex